MLRKMLFALAVLVSIGGVGAMANYSATQGVGTTFGSAVVGGIHYAQHFICDLTTPGQCAAVSAAGAVKVDNSGVTQPVSGTVTSNLGTLNGAATAAAQTTGNASLSSIDGKTPALGQALAAGSVPVILPAATITTLTPPTSVTANLGTIGGVATAANQTNASQKTQIVDGSGNIIASTSNNLNVQCANCSGSGVSTADGASFTAGSSLFAGTGGIYQASATSNPLTSGQQGLAQLTANRALFSNLRNTAGAEIATASIPLRIDPTGTTTQPVSGTVTANVGTGTRAVSIASGQVASGAFASGSLAAGAQVDLLTMRGTKAAGTAAANSLLTGGVYNATPPTLTDGQQAASQMDASGNIKVNIAAGASSGAVAQGSSTSGQTGGLTQAATTTAAPTYSNGTTNPLSTDTSGNLRVSVSSAVGLAQGSTTSGQTGSMIMGAVTTSSPSYTTAQTSPLSLDTGGGLRISPAVATAWGVLPQNNAVSGQLGSLVMGAVSNSAPTYTAAQSSALSLTANGGGLRTDITTIGTNNILTGNGATGTGSQRVTIANDSSARAVGGEGATGATVPSGAVLSGVQSGANMVAMIQASASVPIDMSTATTTQLVALSGSTKIYVTSWDATAGGTTTFKLVYGTGTNCGTGTTNLTAAYDWVAQAGIAKGSGLGPVLVVPAGNALCATNSAAQHVAGSVSYTQF